jgi:hypothetical protein
MYEPEVQSKVFSHAEQLNALLLHMQGMFEDCVKTMTCYSILVIITAYNSRCSYLSLKQL